MNQEEIKKLPRHEAQVIAGVYFLMRDDEIVYVGESEDIHRRIGQHRGDKEFDSYSLIEQGDYHFRLKMEDMYIEMFSPVYNKRGSGSDKYSKRIVFKSNFHLINATYKLIKIKGYHRGFLYKEYLKEAPYYCKDDLELIAKKLGYKKAWISHKEKELSKKKKWWGDHKK